MEEVQSDLKLYVSLTRQQGQIRTHPGNLHKIQAFIQWTRDMISSGLDPAGTQFPVQDTATLLKNYKSHKAFMDKSKIIAEAAKPVKFKENMRWEDWSPTFHQFPKSTTW